MSVVGEFADAVDLLVIGGGPGGYTAAAHAAALGREVTLVDRAGPDGLGGTCLHVGCIPSKALIELAHATHQAREPPMGGLTVTGATVDLAGFQAWRDELCRGLAGGVVSLLAGAGVTVLHGEARFNRPDRVAVRTPDGNVTFLEFTDAIIATGSAASALPGLPLDGERVLDSTGALALDHLPGTVAVVGAGYIGLELGTALAKLGSAVTIVEATDRVLPAMDPALTRPVLRRLEALGVDVLRESPAAGLDDGALVVDGPQGTRRVPADVVVVATGRAPATAELGLAAAGIAADDRGFLAAGPDRRVAPHVAAIGDVVAGPALAHKATAEARVAAEVLSGRPAIFDPAVVPVVAYTDPEVASVGLTEAEARAEEMDVRVATVPLGGSGRARILSSPEGFARIVADAATDRVVGVHLAGPHASELASGAALAVELMAAPGDIAGTIHPHPTIGESVHEAALRLEAG